jgi:hypothetical protein
MSNVTVEIDGWTPAEVADYDDIEFLDAEHNLIRALGRYVNAGARPDNLSECIANFLEELGDD